MKILIIVAIVVTSFLVPRNLKAQGVGNMERINTYKIAFFTRRLNLTPAEAEKFWPVYNEFDNKRLALQQERASTIRMVNLEERKMSDDELIKAADRLVELQVEEANLARTFHDKLKQLLPPAKVVRVYQAENMFRNQLLNDLREQREIRRQPRNIRQVS